MRFLFRADASIALGAGHIVRCATLGRQLVQAGHSARFICRSGPGNLISWLETNGFDVWPLPPELIDENQDAYACLDLARGEPFDWLIVDHYQLGMTWEKLLAHVAERTLVIDDIARPHACDLLLDQNPLNPLHAKYPALLPPHCSTLLGPLFALVRPEFAGLRHAALRRRPGQLDRILVAMGASDPENETTKVLAGLEMIGRPELQIDVVIGASNPHHAEVENACARLPRARLHVQTEKMAELMAASDCAINAGGSTTWERCTLGLPGIVTICSDNQLEIAQSIHRAGAHQCLGWYNRLQAKDYAQAITELTPDRMQSMSTSAAQICDGQGAARVRACLLQ